MLSHVKDVWRVAERADKMLSRGDVRVCTAYSEVDDEMEHCVKDELERRCRLHLARYIFPDHSECSNT